MGITAQVVTSILLHSVHNVLSVLFCWCTSALTCFVPLQGGTARVLSQPDGDVELPDGVLRRPDGDVELSDEFQKTFRVPPCPRCGGVLKPNVVFFGDGLPASRAAR